LYQCLITGNSAVYEGGGTYDSTLTSCTISNNSAGDNGGGSYYGVLNDCVLTGNSAGGGGGGTKVAPLNNCLILNNQAGGGGGGGANESTLNNCVLTANSTTGYGGGANYFTTLNNCTLIGNSAILNGGGADSCTLSNCIVSTNAAGNAGGGASAGILNNCVLTGNSASYGGGAYDATLNGCTLRGNSAMEGGGACHARLNNCTVTGNSAADNGGGVAGDWLNNCLVVSNSSGFAAGGANALLTNCIIAGNSSSYGGGANGLMVNCTLVGNTAHNAGNASYESELDNCIVYYNSAPGGSDTVYCWMNHCCTPELSFYDVGSITNAPLFVNPGDADFHLQTNSPCINSGNNVFAVATNDLDGNARIRGGTVDIGAYEFQTPASIISYAWLQQFGLPTDGTADYADADGDGFNNWQEWRTGTSPMDSASYLKLTAVTNDGSGITITWQSVNGVAYFIQRSTNLLTRPAFYTIANDIAGQPGTTSFTDTTATGGDLLFYRVGVNNPRSGQWVQWDPAAGGNGHWYLAVSVFTGITWVQADQLAQAAGCYLATITSPAENDFVFGLIDSPNFFQGPGGNGAGPVIGGYWNNDEWFWVTGEPWDYTSWAPTQPDNPGYETRLQYWSGSQGMPTPTWNDFPPDDSNSGGYIIERDTQPPPAP
jgi:hypothetical protein